MIRQVGQDGRPLTQAGDLRIGLYEDDCALAGEIVIAFAAQGLSVVRLADDRALRDAVRTQGVAALIMDRMVEGVDSLGMLEGLRAVGDRIPVVVVSSLSSVDDRVRGLKAGGDDYLVKPFAMGELIARVQAVARRAHDDRKIAVSAGPLHMDLIARTVQRDGRTLHLLPREFTLLEYLMRHANQIVTRAMLLEDVWHYKLATQTNVVDVHIGNLRRKVDAPDEARLINSVRGVGFRLDA